MSIVVENLVHIYSPGTPFESRALNNVNFSIEKGEFIGLIGHTGSGKSTLIQHLNGLLKASSGKIVVDGLDITSKDVKLTEVRKRVGLVFQYPEYQLFEETIAKDIAFGPTNLGLDGEEIEKRVKEAMEMVGLDYETLKDRSPFDLSGGQRRRVAIAGVIAMKPEVLILDEPTAGLDPHGRDEILNQIKTLHKKYNTTIILVSHSMEDVARLADKLIVMSRGEVALMGKPKDVFKEGDRLREIGLDVPMVSQLVHALKDKGFDIDDDVITVEDAKREIIKYLRREGKC